MQWALGIMMYQMLSGHLPFWNAQSDRSPFAVMSAILNAEVEPPCQPKIQSSLCMPSPSCRPYCLRMQPGLHSRHASR